MSEADETKVDPVPTEIWTPPEMLPANVGRMAWALFLEAWKVFISHEMKEAAKPGSAIEPDEPDLFHFPRWSEEIYKNCIDSAYAIENVNQNPPKRKP